MANSYVALPDQQQPSAPPPYEEKEIPQQLQDTFAKMQSPDYVQAFETKVDGKALVEGLKRVFIQNEIPLGLMTKLTDFRGLSLDFKIDNSGSMTRRANLLAADLSPYVADLSCHMKDKLGIPVDKHATRWEEAADRLHILIDVLAYVPTGPITLSFFDTEQKAGKQLVLDRKGKSPEVFLKEAHQAIASFFKIESEEFLGETPAVVNLQNMLRKAKQQGANSDKPRPLYFLTDGDPTGPNGKAAEIQKFSQLLQSRDAQAIPFTILGCSNQRKDYAWMHEMEEVADYVAALPDFVDEQQEVLRDQGPRFPYSRGMWLLCNLAAALNPDDLDSMDQHPPFTKKTLENLLGRIMSAEEYSGYFYAHPNADDWKVDYDQFAKLQSASAIGSVRLFQDTLKLRLRRDIQGGNDDSEREEVEAALRVVRDSRKRGYGSMYQGGEAREAFIAPQGQNPSQDCCTIL